jgi:hypothetical protein
MGAIIHQAPFFCYYIGRDTKLFFSEINFCIASLIIAIYEILSRFKWLKKSRLITSLTSAASTICFRRYILSFFSVFSNLLPWYGLTIILFWWIRRVSLTSVVMKTTSLMDLPSRSNSLFLQGILSFLSMMQCSRVSIISKYFSVIVYFLLICAFKASCTVILPPEGIS